MTSPSPIATPPARLVDYNTTEIIRDASREEIEQSNEAARRDGGRGVIEVDGRSCYCVQKRLPSPNITGAPTLPTAVEIAKLEHAAAHARVGDDKRIASARLHAAQQSLGGTLLPLAVVMEYHSGYGFRFWQNGVMLGQDNHVSVNARSAVDQFMRFGPGRRLTSR